MRLTKVVLVVIGVVALACNLSPRAGDDSATTRPGSTPAAPQLTPTPEGPPPPTSFDEVLLAEVEHGATYEDSLISLLQSFLGEAPDDLPDGTRSPAVSRGSEVRTTSASTPRATVIRGSPPEEVRMRGEASRMYSTVGSGPRANRSRSRK